jgi:sulfite exporter TauE/SafE
MYLLAALSLGFLSSLHCIGMCGPIALALPLDRSSVFTTLKGMLTYNSGRILTYSILGLLFGLLGQGMVLATSQNILSVTSGILILLMVLVPYLKIQLPSSGLLHKAFVPLRSAIGKLFGIHSQRSLFLIGLLNGLLPCGLVYVGITGALATGSTINGTLFMALFGAGTLPAMTLIVFSRNMFTVSARERIRKAVPVLVCFTACLLILRGMSLGIPYISPAMNETGVIQHCCHK